MYAPGYSEVVPRMVSVWTPRWGYINEAFSATSPASAAYETANRGIWWPLLVPATCVVRRFWWANGSTVSASYSVEVGLYLDGGYKPGAKLITTGSVAQGNATELQFVDVTDTPISTGLWWIYMSCNTTSATFFRSTLTSSNVQELGGFQQASVGPGSAPNPAVPVERAGQAVYLCGFATTASP